MTKYLIGLVALLIVIGGGAYFLTKAETVSGEVVIEGDYAPGNLRLESGTTLTVKGDFTLDKTLSCAGGPVAVIVEGAAAVNGSILCKEEGSNFSLVAQSGFVMSKDAEVEVNGNVQFVSSANLLLTTDEAIQKKFDEIGTDSGAGMRVGPLVSDGEAPITRIFPTIKHSNILQNVGMFFAPKTARAQVPAPVVIAGAMVVGTPPPGVKRLVIFAFPDATEVSIADFELTGPDGREGEDDKGANCIAKGKPGEDAFRFNAVAPNLKVNNFTLNLGDGGEGGDAETPKDCDPGRATGGAGGKSGNFKMIGSSSFLIEGAFLVNPGDSGAGGNATALGKDGAPKEKGGDATANGGRGADNKKVLRFQGTVAGASNIQVGDTVAGAGGWGSAEGGIGGDGPACGDKGGAGGNGTATGGGGGDARTTLGGGATRAEFATDIGGVGGGADSTGGVGGAGGSCGPDKKGGDGGKGGDANSTEGKGGSGAHGNAADGLNLAEDGGAGGNGGDGCTEGKGGKGGAGDPKGADGKDGKNLCVLPPEKKDTGVVPGGGTGTTGDTTGTTGGTTIDVIKYGNEYIPVSQLRIGPVHPPHESGSGCPGEHWHADGPVTTVSGKTVSDPNPGGCGFGEVSKVPVQKISAGAGAAPASSAVVSGSFKHVKPGEYSEVYATVTGLAPGTQVDGLLNGGGQSGAPASATADGSGNAKLTWRIYEYGPYNLDISAGSFSKSTTVNVD